MTLSFLKTSSHASSNLTTEICVDKPKIIELPSPRFFKGGSLIQYSTNLYDFTRSNRSSRFGVNNYKGLSM